MQTDAGNSKRASPPNDAERIAQLEQEVQRLRAAQKASRIRNAFDTFAEIFVVVFIIAVFVLARLGVFRRATDGIRNYDKVYSEGYDDGYGAGCDGAGYDDGYDGAGYDEGFDAGYDLGHSDGYGSGCSDGYNEGYDEGYDDGYFFGYEDACGDVDYDG